MSLVEDFRNKVIPNYASYYLSNEADEKYNCHMWKWTVPIEGRSSLVVRHLFVTCVSDPVDQSYSCWEGDRRYQSQIDDDYPLTPTFYKHPFLIFGVKL